MIDRRDFIKKSLVSPLALLPAQYPSALVAQSPDDYKDILSYGMVPGSTKNFWFLRSISLNFVFYRAWLNVPFAYVGESDWLPRAVLAWLSAFPLARIEEVFPPEELSVDSFPDFAFTGSNVELEELSVESLPDFAFTGSNVELSDPNSWLSDPNSWLSDPNSWLRDPNSWLSDPNSWLRDSWLSDSWLSDVDNFVATISMREEFQQRLNFSWSNDSRYLVVALEETFSNKKDDFFEWCNSAGITETQANNILSAQALFAIHFAMYNVTEEEPEILTRSITSSREVGLQRIVEIFNNFTWIWPFC